MALPTRYTRQYNFIKLDLLSLRKLGRKVVCSERFHRNYGNYDPAYHCFGFPDYQLIPTLEEYSHWTDLLILDKVPFSGLEKTPKYSAIATALHLTTAEVVFKGSKEY